MLEVFSRLHAAAGQQCVGGADHGGVPKSHSDVEIIILFQKGIVNDAEDVAPVVVPVFIHKLRRDTLQLIGKTVFTGNIKTAFQRRRYHIPMLRLILPKVRAARVLAAACVGYIEYISQLGIISGSVNESDTLAAAPYIPAHLFVPEVVFRTGRSFRALGENHKLFVVGVLIQPRSGGQKRRPLLVASRDLPRRVVCHLCVEL